MQPEINPRNGFPVLENPQKEVLHDPLCHLDQKLKIGRSSRWRRQPSWILRNAKVCTSSNQANFALLTTYNTFPKKKFTVISIARSKFWQVDYCYTPSHTSIRFCLESFISCAFFSGRLTSHCPYFVRKYIGASNLEFYRVFYIVALSEWRQRMMHRMSGRHSLRKR